MKIFNWVQRKFNPNALKEEDSRRDDVNNTKSKLEDRVESQSLLVDGSILAIGTFGLDPSILRFHDQKIMEMEPEREEEEYGSDSGNRDNEGEENPLVFTTYKHDLNGSVGEITDYSSDDSDHKKIMGERTTLADLFLAESEVGINVGSVRKLVFSEKKDQKLSDLVTTETHEAKNGLSFGKKLVPPVGEKLRPVKKLNQIMRRMMKRKIHPDFDMRKAAAHNKHMESQELESINEFAYLLPI